MNFDPINTLARQTNEWMRGTKHGPRAIGWIEHSLRIAVDESYAEGFRAGAEAMREAAAKIVDESNYGPGSTAAKDAPRIRALPLPEAK